MPFPKSAQSQGGKAPASDYQKQVARTWIKRNSPSARSTGPRSPLGKLVSKYNRVRGIYRKTVKSWHEQDFDQACQDAERAIADFDQDRKEHSKNYSKFCVKRFQSQDTSGNFCVVFVIQANFEGWPEEYEAWIDRIQRLRKVHGAEGQLKYKAATFIPDNDPWLREILDKIKLS